MNREELADAIAEWLRNPQGYSIHTGDVRRIKVNVNSELPVTLTIIHESPDA